MNKEAIDKFFDKVTNLTEELRGISKEFEAAVKSNQTVPVEYKLVMPNSISARDAARCAIIANRIMWEDKQPLDELVVSQEVYNELPEDLRQYFVRH